MTKTESITIGTDYRLDGKIIVKVIKSLNRSATVFSVETPDQSIITVEKDRLSPAGQTGGTDNP